MILLPCLISTDRDSSAALRFSVTQKLAKLDECLEIKTRNYTLTALALTESMNMIESKKFWKKLLAFEMQNTASFVIKSKVQVSRTFICVACCDPPNDLVDFRILQTRLNANSNILHIFVVKIKSESLLCRNKTQHCHEYHCILWFTNCFTEIKVLIYFSIFWPGNSFTLKKNVINLLQCLEIYRLYSKGAS